MVEVVWDSPSADSRGSMPIGNGDIGANVWVEPSGDLLLLLSKSDAWDEVSRLCKLGLLRIKLPSVTGFRQELRLADGEIRITAGGVTTRVWIDANWPAAHVEMKGVQTFTTSVAHETWRTQEKTLKDGEIRACWGQQGSPDPLIIAADTVLDGQKNQIVFFHRNPTSVWEKNLRNQSLDALVKPENDPPAPDLRRVGARRKPDPRRQKQTDRRQARHEFFHQCSRANSAGTGRRRLDQASDSAG